MPFVPAIIITTSFDASFLSCQDTSGGSDGAIASRLLFIYQVDNTLLIPAVPWAYPTPNPITLNPFTADIAANIVVQWLDAGGNVLYTTSQIYAFTTYGELFYATTTRTQQSKPNKVNDTNYYDSKEKLRVQLDSAVQAINVMNDVYSAENCISIYTDLINNQADYF